MKTNALARGLEGFPEYWREYGSRILLVVLVAAIVFLLVRYWNDKKATDARIVAESIDTAATSLQELQQLPAQSVTRSATEIAENREKLRQQADQAINTVLNTTKDPKMLVAAHLDRGNLNWTLANFPETPGSTTLPSSQQLTNRDAFLDQAKSSYEKVLDPSYKAPVANAFAARMGLAAIAENQGQWDQSKAQYQAIVDAPNMPASFKELASKRLSNLARYQTPALLVPAPTLTTEPSTTPATSEPTATSQPSAAPAATPLMSPATSQPTTRP